MGEPGWDAKAISRIAKERFGGLKQMFEHHGLPEKGAAMMPAQGKRVCEVYGTIQAFVEKYDRN